MDWLTQNWIWIVAAIAVVFLLQRSRWGERAHHGANLGAQGHDHGAAERPGAAAPGAALDPVSGNPVRTDRALTAAHGGRVFYFESAETRQRFEAEPDKYAANAPATPNAASGHRRRHGC